MTVEAHSSLSCDDLQDQDSKAVDVRLDWENAFHCIFRRHVATAKQSSTYHNQVAAWCGSFLYGPLNCAYNVPTTRFVLNWFWSPPNILAIPKSDILGFMSASRRMLLALRSRWTTRNLESRWRYSSPLAMPSIISNRFFQSRSPCFSGSVQPQWSEFNHIC